MQIKDIENSNIIEFILSEQEKTKTEIQSQIADHKTVIDNTTFFTDNFPMGIMSKNQFSMQMHSSSKNDLIGIKTLFNAMSENRKINTSAFAMTDKKGQEYYWLKLYGENGATEFRISNFPGLDKLMQGYLFNMYNVSLTLEELYSEATNNPIG